MAATMKDIKLRINSVSNTMQITKAMELVASSKLRRAQDRMTRSRPYFETLYQTLSDIAATGADNTSPYTQVRTVKRSCWIVIAGDRGLAGAYNSNVLKLATSEMAGKNAVVVPIGKKALEYFSHRPFEVLTDAYASAASLSVSDCFTLARTLCTQFRDGEFDEIHIVFTTFISVLAQQPTTLQLLPRTAEHRAAASTTSRQIIMYEPDSESVYNAIVPECLGGMLFGALCESITSELGARRTAMDSATDNAKDMLEDLSLKYNRARQGSITQEITEIVAGSQV